MSETYTVLRDMAHTSSEEPFRARAEAFVAAAPPATRLDRAELTQREVGDLARARDGHAWSHHGRDGPHLSRRCGGAVVAGGHRLRPPPDVDRGVGLVQAP